MGSYANVLKTNNKMESVNNKKEFEGGAVADMNGKKVTYVINNILLNFQITHLKKRGIKPPVEYPQFLIPTTNPWNIPPKKLILFTIMNVNEKVLVTDRGVIPSLSDVEKQLENSFFKHNYCALMTQMSHLENISASIYLHKEGKHVFARNLFYKNKVKSNVKQQFLDQLPILVSFKLKDAEKTVFLKEAEDKDDNVILGKDLFFGENKLNNLDNTKRSDIVICFDTICKGGRKFALVQTQKLEIDGVYSIDKDDNKNIIFTQRFKEKDGSLKDVKAKNEWKYYEDGIERTFFFNDFQKRITELFK